MIFIAIFKFLKNKKTERKEISLQSRINTPETITTNDDTTMKKKEVSFI